jgi:hypothetical protein
MCAATPSGRFAVARMMMAVANRPGEQVLSTFGRNPATDIFAVSGASGNTIRICERADRINQLRSAAFLLSRFSRSRKVRSQ